DVRLPRKARGPRAPPDEWVAVDHPQVVDVRLADAGGRAQDSVGGPQIGEHRKVTNVRRQQLGLEQGRGRCDQVIGVVDAAMGAAVALSELAGSTCYLLADRNPGQSREELLER